MLSAAGPRSTEATIPSWLLSRRERGGGCGPCGPCCRLAGRYTGPQVLPGLLGPTLTEAGCPLAFGIQLLAQAGDLGTKQSAGTLYVAPASDWGPGLLRDPGYPHRQGSASFSPPPFCAPALRGTWPQWSGKGEVPDALPPLLSPSPRPGTSPHTGAMLLGFWNALG